MYKHLDSQGEPKFAGRSKAKVIDNRDPLKRGRVIVDHPLLGETVWIDYLKTRSNFDPPSIGDIVYVECDCGEYDYPVAWGNVTKGIDIRPDLPETFQREVPTNRGLYTPNGHFIEMDDGEAEVTAEPNDTQFTTKERGIRITSKANNKIHIIEDSEASKEYILVEDANGNRIKLDYVDNEVTIESKGTTKFITADNKEETVGGNLSVKVEGDIEIEAGGGAKGKFASGQVAFGTSSIELLQQLSDTLQSLIALTASMQTETHIGNMGYPTAVPDNAGDYATAESELSALKGLVDTIKGSL